MKMLSVLQPVVENEGRKAIRASERFLWMRSEQERGKIKSPIYEAGAGVNTWFCADECDSVGEEAAARVLA